MSAFVDLLGDTPRVAVLGVFAEYPDQLLSTPEIIAETGKARRAVYYTMERLLEDGIIIVADRQGKARLFALNKNDIRARALPLIERILVIGSLESEIKRDLPLPHQDELPEEVIRRIGASNNDSLYQKERKKSSLSDDFIV